MPHVVREVLAPLENPIYVTRPFLPPLHKFVEGLTGIWESRQLTNNGPVLKRFRSSLSRYLQTENVALFNNGTLALQIGLQAMNISGEVITTPFTFVATTHALYWNKIRPVFVDIEPDYYTLDPERIEAAITPFTTAIVAVHVYGHPCRHEALQEVASRHGLRLIYDAAHAFGVTVNDTSIARFGDLSMFSFHATKLFHSLEGGALTFPDPVLKAQVDLLKNFGFKNETEVVLPGTNGKMNEMQALMGQVVLGHVPQIIAARRKVYQRYRRQLADTPGIKVVAPLPETVGYNYAYMPVEIEPAEFGISRDALYEALQRFNIFSRRYFYPLVCDFSCYREIPLTDPLTVARAVADRILTLPIYHDLSLDDVDRICEVIAEIQKAPQAYA